MSRIPNKIIEFSSIKASEGKPIDCDHIVKKHTLSTYMKSDIIKNFIKNKRKETEL